MCRCRCKQPLPVPQLGHAGICGSVQQTRLGNWLQLRIPFFFFWYNSYLGSVQQKIRCLPSSLTHVPSWSHEQLLGQRLWCFHQEKCSWSYTLGSAFPIAKKAFDCGARPCFIACEDNKGDRCVSKISQWGWSQSVSFLSSLRLQLFQSRVKIYFLCKNKPCRFYPFFFFLYKHFRYTSKLLRNRGRKCNHKYF